MKMIVSYVSVPQHCVDKSFLSYSSPVLNKDMACQRCLVESAIFCSVSHAAHTMCWTLSVPPLRTNRPSTCLVRRMLILGRIIVSRRWGLWTSWRLTPTAPDWIVAMQFESYFLGIAWFVVAVVEEWCTNLLSSVSDFPLPNIRAGSSWCCCLCRMSYRRNSVFLKLTAIKTDLPSASSLIDNPIDFAHCVLKTI